MAAFAARRDRQREIRADFAEARRHGKARYHRFRLAEADTTPKEINSVAPKHEDVHAAVRESWDYWLADHDVSVPNTIEEAVEKAFNNWLNRHGSDLIETAVEKAFTKWADSNTDEIRKAIADSVTLDRDGGQ